MNFARLALGLMQNISCRLTYQFDSFHIVVELYSHLVHLSSDQKIGICACCLWFSSRFNSEFVTWDISWSHGRSCTKKALSKQQLRLLLDTMIRWWGILQEIVQANISRNVSASWQSLYLQEVHLLETRKFGERWILEWHVHNPNIATSFLLCGHMDWGEAWILECSQTLLQLYSMVTWA